MANILSSGAEETRAFRRQRLEYYRQRATALQQQEGAVKAALHPEVLSIVSCKRITLFDEMLRDAGVQDPSLVDDLKHGFRLTGELKPSGLFPRQFRPASLSTEDLKATAKWSKHLAAASCRRAAGDVDVARTVWAETLEQVQKKWLKGPLTWEEVDERFRGVWLASKRFGVVQGEKTRSVDDLSEFLVNSSVTETEKVILDGVDHIAATARFFMGAADSSKGTFCLPALGSGSVSGFLHSSWGAGVLGFKGRALDLKAAYKQLARHPADSWATILAVYNPDDDGVHYFEAVALPFGGKSSVTGFNRMARSLKLIMSRLFWLVNTSYYDDFCQVECDELAESAAETAEQVLGLLGWEISRGDKLKPFAKSFDILGVTISFARAAEGLVEVANRAGRIDDLCSLLEEIASQGHLCQDKLASFKGRLLFATNHVFGRCAQVCTQLISQALRAHGGADAFQEVVQAAREALRMLRKSGPRQISVWGSDPPVLIFSDGACEDEGRLVTHGAVMFDMATGCQEFYGDSVPSWLVAKWRRTGLKQLIYFAELLPVLVAKLTWRHVVRRRLCVFYLDNEAARACLIRSFSPVCDATDLLMAVASADLESHAMSWYARVPSKSNVADDASRLQFARCVHMFRRVEPVYEGIR